MLSFFTRELHFFLIKKWYFDILYNRYIATVFYKVGYDLYVLGDQGLLEFIGPQGIFNTLSRAPVVKSVEVPILYNLMLTVISILTFLFFSFFELFNVFFLEFY